MVDDSIPDQLQCTNCLLPMQYQEKKDGKDSFVNAGFAVFNSKIFDFINRKSDILEKDIKVKVFKMGSG